MRYLHPRPSSIVAALYTARDLGVDVAILHGPSGCSFKHARLLEEDGMRVLTTSLAENEFIFGGESRLEEVLAEAEASFAPVRMAVIGTCVAMIIGEDLESAVRGVTTPTIAVEIHAGYPENIDGVIATLEAAAGAGWIDEQELDRQRRLLTAANEVERLRGGASRAYIEPERGDLKHLAARRLLELARSGLAGIAVMNAKKETAYMFSDVLAALHEAAPGAPVRYIANLEERGLSKIRADARRVREGLEGRGVPVEAIGALDEYGALGERLGAEVRASGAAYALVAGVPHAIPREYTDGVEVFSITNGPRQVAPLRDLGHAHVMVEVDLHPRTLGVRSIVESEFGTVLRSMT
ncbi:MAG: Ni-sirohydrochlorin a,c-diamide reductive cyclase catalytic subunit [Methanospirillum sp.]|nr:Ni-sirohydrochlorin a,c-diamide reductive cyclase catalytic subunit [Methanospirillum sp.]